MNKFVNILLLIVMIPTLGLTIYVGFDLPIEFLKVTGSSLPYRHEMFLLFAGIIFIIGGRRSMRRWVGMRMVSQISRFQWNEPMDNSRIRQAMMYLNLEAAMHFFLAIGTYQVTPQAWPVSIVLMALGFDHLFFGLYGRARKKFRVGITKSAIVVADRDVKVIYYTGLRKVSTQQQSLFFDYIKDLQIAIPIGSISAENRSTFRQTVEGNVDRDVVYFSEGFKEF